jgi:glycosyltransferase involved in cell wall biosynthesis
MITVIVASADGNLLQQLRRNIDNTIGVPYELLTFPNSKGQKGICQIYNEATADAKYDLLCFMHEDIVLHTEEWGRIVLDIFNQNQNLGILGIAGSSYKAITPTGWLSNSDIETEYSNLIQSFKYSSHPTEHRLKNRGNKKLAKVTAADGVWLCTLKKIAVATRFDESTFKRFHCYDVDFCLSVGQQYDIAVTFDVLLHHLSEGNFDRAWIEEILKLHEKWIDHLPLYTESYTLKQIRRIEMKSFKFFVKQLVAFEFPVHIAYQVLNKKDCFLKLGVPLYLKMHYYIIKYFFLKRKAI